MAYKYQFISLFQVKDQNDQVVIDDQGEAQYLDNPDEQTLETIQEAVEAKKEEMRNNAVEAPKLL